MVKISLRNTILLDYIRTGAVQALNYLVPLLIIPYIVRILGKENFGLIAVSQAFAAYFLLVVNYSFNLSATRDLVAAGDQKERVNQLFNEVFQTKIFLFALCTVVFITIVFSIRQFHRYAFLHCLLFLSNFGWVLYQSWFFQGQRIFRVAIFFNVISKIILGAGVFLFLRQPQDYILYAALILTSQLLLGIISLVYLVRRYSLRFFQFRFSSVRRQLKSGASIFYSNVFINFSTTSNLFLLSFFGSLQSIANYAAGSKIIGIVVSVVITSFTLTAYPYVAKKMLQNKKDGYGIVQANAWICLILGVITTAILLLTSKWILLFVYGAAFEDALFTYRLLCFIPIPLFLNEVFVVQGMLNLKLDKVFFKLTMVSASFSIGLNLLLAYHFKEAGTAIAWLSTELFIAMISFGILSRQIPLFTLKSARIGNIFNKRTVHKIYE